VLAVAHETRAPVTVRGGGTGNYGQSVPLHGGLVVNMERLTRIVSIEEGRARVQAGVRFVDLDQEAYASGQEICIYPSTYLTATIAGFVAGGSMGVGSVMHGTLADNNVLAATVLPVTASPAAERVEGMSLTPYVHAYGTTGVLVDVTVPLTARKRWEQAVISFASLEACHEFCLALLTDPTIDKRLITAVDPGVVRHFSRSRLRFDSERTAALLLYREDQRDAVVALATPRGGRLDVTLAPDSRTRITDFTWNHTTLWAKKADRRHLTYLQCGFDVERFPRQIAAIRAAYGEDFAFHGEYALSGGAPFLASLPIVAYRGQEHLDHMIEFLEGLEVSVANPHRYVLEEGSRVENVAELVETKRRNDPAGLLNPGKLAAWTEHGTVPRKQASLSLARTRGGRRA
jgi:FAD/FMN-containing dehydrogenase